MIETLDIPYTYFETDNGLICYSYGKYAKYTENLLVGSVVGYFCEEKTSRIQLSTGKFVKKLIFEGNEITIRDEILDTLPDKTRTTLIENTILHPETKEEMFTVNYKSIIKVYSPKLMLRDLLNKKIGASSTQIEIARKVISLLNKKQVVNEDIGVYGSLQAGITKKSGDNDVDIVIHGLKNYAKVQKLLIEKNKDQIMPESKYKQFSKNAIWNNTSINRKLNSKLLLGKLGTSDIRVVETKNDKRSMDYEDLKFDQEIIEIEGRVVDSKESLTIPSVYKIETKKGSFTVGTRLYVFLGAAKAGDYVKARGTKLKNQNGLWIANQNDQYIVTSHLSQFEHGI